MRTVKVILRNRKTLIALIHITSDPSNWIVRQWHRSWWRKKRILSEWYHDSEQAVRRAEELRTQHEAGLTQE